MKYLVEEKITTTQIDTWEFEEDSESALRRKMKKSCYTDGSKLDSKDLDTKYTIVSIKKIK